MAFEREDIRLLDEYKDKYEYVYLIEINEEEFIFREVTRKEFKKLGQYFPDPYDREEELCKMCVIEPEEYNFHDCNAGIPFTLAEKILYESGFSNNGSKINMMLSQYRNEAQSFEGRVDALITEAFPLIRIEEIETWSTEKILKYYALAEYKLVNYRGAEPVQNENAGQNNFDPSDFPELM
ncbi:MAG TPA: hypothetical protein VK190_03175 [Pseudoneobacillus sp.]|nr:hypothetical protein [Pseudoneobacillus sp.]